MDSSQPRGLSSHRVTASHLVHTRFAFSFSAPERDARMQFVHAALHNCTGYGCAKTGGQTCHIRSAMPVLTTVSCFSALPLFALEP